jgi:hypothetical protein
MSIKGHPFAKFWVFAAKLTNSQDKVIGIVGLYFGFSLQRALGCGT